MSRPAFPEETFTTWSVIRSHTAFGLFAERQAQAMQLFVFPDFGDGDLTREQRQEALLRSASHHVPLVGLSLFLSIVALEDLLRDLGARLAECPEIIDLFEHATQLRPVQVKKPKPFARLDRDPVALTDFDAVNDRFEKVFGVRPIPETCLPPLYDLAIMRHTVAHHAARVRDIDRDRFRYWSVRAGRPINPPVAYLKKLQTFLYQVGRSFDVAIRNAIFSRFLSRHGSFDLQRAGLVHLIEVFDYFGHLLTQEPGDILPQPWATDYDQQLEAADRTAHQRLLALCFTDLNASFPFHVADPLMGLAG